MLFCSNICCPLRVATENEFQTDNISADYISFQYLLGNSFALFTFISNESCNILQICAMVRFTNLQCNSLDKSFSEFPYCFIKSVNRTYQYFSLKIALHQIPLNGIIAHFNLLKRSNGGHLQPFLYNISFDACKFLKLRKKFPIVKFIYDSVGEFTNVNHTCPFNVSSFAAIRCSIIMIIFYSSMTLLWKS